MLMRIVMSPVSGGTPLANQWVETPVHLPRKCALTGTSLPDAGPYLETDFRYFDADPHAAATGELRLNTLHISQQFLTFALGMPGSPYAGLTTAEVDALETTISEQAAQIATLEARVAELEAGAPVTIDQASLRLMIDNGTERSSTPASSAPSSSMDPDHHDDAPKRRPRQKAVA